MATEDSALQDNIIVYTCIAGDYDRQLMPVSSECGVDFVCFTNNRRVRGAGWSFRPLAETRLTSDPQAINRFHKCFPHHLFPEQRWSVYIDGNIRFDGDWRDLVRAIAKQEAAVGAFTHPKERNLIEEVAACNRSGRFSSRDARIAERQLLFYKNRGVHLELPISANYLLVRDHWHSLLAPTMSLWWAQLFEWTSRDQLSLGYALHRGGANMTWLDSDAGISSERLTRMPHHQPLMRRAYRKARGATRRLMGFPRSRGHFWPML